MNPSNQLFGSSVASMLLLLLFVGNVRSDEATRKRQEQFQAHGMFSIGDPNDHGVVCLCFSPDSKKLAYASYEKKGNSWKIVVMDVSSQKIAETTSHRASRIVFGDNENLIILYRDTILKWNLMTNEIVEGAFDHLKRIQETHFGCAVVDERLVTGDFIYLSSQDGLERLNWRAMKMESVFSWELLQDFYAETARENGVTDKFARFRFYTDLPSLLYANDTTLFFRFTHCQFHLMSKNEGEWEIKRLYPINIVSGYKPSNVWVDTGEKKLSRLSWMELLSTDFSEVEFKRPFYGEHQGPTSPSLCLDLLPVQISEKYGLIVDNGNTETVKDGIILRVFDTENGEELAQIVNSQHPVLKKVTSLSDMRISPDGRYLYVRFNDSSVDKHKAVIWDLSTIREK